MKIIPVIDIKDGLVVSAQQGQRLSYQPIQSKLCVSSTIENVLKGFLSLYPFDTFYIADLNAITNTGDNLILIEETINKNKPIEFWVDNGQKIQNIPAINKVNYRLVIGSEYQDEMDFTKTQNILKRHILSLDYFPDKGYTGPATLLENTELWPKEVIIMCLNRVGKNNGPDLEKLMFFNKKHQHIDFIAAGGIRDEKDLLQLKSIGINQVLIASALHSGKINAQSIQNLHQIPATL